MNDTQHIKENHQEIPSILLLRLDQLSKWNERWKNVVTSLKVVSATNTTFTINERNIDFFLTLPYLTTLDLTDCHSTIGLVKNLGWLPKLTTLKIKFTDESLDSWNQEHIKHISTLTNITSLTVSSCNINSLGANYISRMKNLTHLDISHNIIGSEGCECISRLENLTSFSVQNNSIKAKGVEYISCMKNITHLDVSNNYIGVEGCKYLSSNKYITHLNIRRNQIGSEGAMYLSKMKQLVKLNLWANNIETNGARCISRLSNLTDLAVGEIETSGVKSIACLTNLTNLCLWGDNITEDGMVCIVESLPNLKFITLGLDKFDIYRQYSGSDIEIYNQVQKQLTNEKRNYWRIFHKIPLLFNQYECIEKCKSILYRQHQSNMNTSSVFALVVLDGIVSRQLQVDLVECQNFVNQYKK